MDAAYLKAAHPEPFTIFGTKLKPFCLGHEILFQRFGNRFSIESTEQPQIEDCLTGVFICSQPYRSDVSLDGFRIPLAIRFRGKILGPPIKEFNLFAQYIAAHTEIPDFYSKGDDTAHSEVGAPTIQAVKVSLMANLGLSEEEALNTPLSLAYWNCLAWSEAQGGIQIIDAAERARQEQKLAEAKAMEARIEELGKFLFPNGYTTNQRMSNDSVP